MDPPPPPPPLPPITLTVPELAAIQAGERPDIRAAGRSWQKGEGGGGGTGDAGGLVGGKGREWWSRRGGNMARNKQNPNEANEQMDVAH